MSVSKKSIRAHLPLRPAVLHILVSLAEGSRHGYAIKKDVESRTNEIVRMGPGTLYETLERLEDRHLIREVRRKRDDADHAQRRYYELTVLGRRVLEAEILRLGGLVADAQRMLEGAGS